MAITTLAKVKLVLEISGIAKDDLIELLIPAVEADYLKIRNKDFDTDDDGNIVYPAEAEFTAIQMIGFHLLSKPLGAMPGAVKGYSLSRYSVTYADLKQTYPDNILAGIKRFVRLM